jgi:PAS domain S-box-containing protein
MTPFADEASRTEPQLRRLNQLYAALLQSNRAIVECDREDDLFPRICAAAVNAGRMKLAWIGLVEQSSSRVRPVASYGEGSDYLSDIDISAGADSPLAAGPTGTAIRERRPIWCQDFMRDPATAPWRDRARRFGWQASAALPLFRGDAAVGALNVYSDQPHAFDREAQELLVEIAACVSRGIGNLAADAEHRRTTERLMESERRLQDILDNTSMVVFVKDLDGRYLTINRRYEELFHITREAIKSRTDRDLFPPEVAERLRQYDLLALEKRTGIEVEEQVPQDDGVHTYVSAKFPLFQSDGTPYGVCGIAHDITARLRTEAALRAAEAKFRGLVEQSMVGVYMVDGDNLLYANPRSEEIFGYGAGELVGRPFLDLFAEADRDAVRGEFARVRRREARFARIDAKGRHRSGEVLMIGIVGALAELGGEQVVIGAVQDITDKWRAERRAAKYMAHLEQAMLGTVSAVSRMMDLRDPYTSGHERRVGEIAAMIASQIGLGTDVQQGLRVAGAVHDVGKITVPAEVLSKPGKLSAVEFELIKSHPAQGFEVLKGIEFPWPVAEVARQHHERWDGSGYPAGLQGESIIVEARILAVADVVEAMSSHRPYRAGLGVEKALAEIERGLGTAYDPQVAEACLGLFRNGGYRIPD